jgi:hypothetical protein
MYDQIEGFGAVIFLILQITNSIGMELKIICSDILSSFEHSILCLSCIVITEAKLKEKEGTNFVPSIGGKRVLFFGFVFILGLSCFAIDNCHLANKQISQRM